LNLTSVFQIQKHSKEIYDELELYAELVPARQVHPAWPIAGFVLNINVVTRIHKDQKDGKGCVVLVLGDFEGGELVLVELGLVLELKHGDMLIFPSKRISHLNLHFKGIRASLVVHTDNGAQGYAEDYNGWEGNSYFY
jgi:hypothetical protein